MRGRHTPKHAISKDDNDHIKDHIMKFNPAISHYRRVLCPNRLYFPSELSVTEMYSNYKQCCEEDKRKCCSYIHYFRTVKSMNISFVKEGIEECDICDAFKIHRKELEVNASKSKRPNFRSEEKKVSSESKEKDVGDNTDLKSGLEDSPKIVVPGESVERENTEKSFSKENNVTDGEEAVA